MNKKVKVALVGATMLVTTSIVQEVKASQTMHTVEKGDTVYLVSKKYGISTTELTAWNGIKDNVIKIGQKIYVVNPYYTVKAGDTLYKIATSKGLTIEKLKELNQLKDNVIKVGQKLVVVSGKIEEVKTETPKTETPKEEIKEKETKEEILYTVKKGDTLYKISVENGVTLTQIRQWNELKTDTIYVGQKLKFYKNKKEEEKYRELTVEASAYTANCTGCSGITATGIDLRKNPDIKLIAVDPTVIKLGTKVWVEGYGEAIAGDKGTAIKGNKIDVYLKNREDALKWGRKQVKIKIYE